MTVADSYAFCRRIAHKHGANFSVGFRFLPKVKRQAVYAAYAFCRWADDIADEEDGNDGPRFNVGDGFSQPGVGQVNAPETGGLKPAPTFESRLERLDAWQAELEACYAGQPAHAITIALADALKHFAIPKSAFIALIDGCRQDMTKTRYETFDDLVHYCDLVATSISDISLSIFGYQTPAALVHGRNLATALQLTNITRDVGDDLTRDRIYIPREELQRFRVTEEDLFARAETERLRALIQFQIERAESYFRAAEPLLAELAFDARFPTLLMGGVYATVLGKLRKDPLMVIRQRLSLTLLQKLLVVGTRVVRPHFV